jgi:hypothetical protein
MTVKQLIIHLLEHDLHEQVQIAHQGELHEIADVWEGQSVILEAWDDEDRG